MSFATAAFFLAAAPVPASSIARDEPWPHFEWHCVLDHKKANGTTDRYWSPILYFNYTRRAFEETFYRADLERHWEERVLAAHPHLKSVDRRKSCSSSWQHISPQRMEEEHQKWILSGDEDWKHIFVDFKPTAIYWGPAGGRASGADSGGSFGSIEIVEGDKPKSPQQVQAERIAAIQERAAAEILQDAATARSEAETRSKLAEVLERLKARGRGQ